MFDTTVGGIGDQGEREAYVALADHVKIGNAVFADVPLAVPDKRARADEDGLIGPAYSSARFGQFE